MFPASIRCDFATTDGFDSQRGRKVIAAEQGLRSGSPDREPGEIAGMYRQLRRSLEDTKDFSEASDFYYGEMEMRRKAADPRRPDGRWRSRSTVDWFVLVVYWAISGNGLRAWRALATLLAVIVLGAGWLFAGGFGFWKALWLSAASAVSFLSPPEADFEWHDR